MSSRTAQTLLPVAVTLLACSGCLFWLRGRVGQNQASARQPSKRVVQPPHTVNGITTASLFDGLIQDVVVGDTKDGWTVWNGLTVWNSSNPKQKCKWTKIRGRENREAAFCSDPDDMYVSREVRSSGKWPDCEILVDLWTKKPKAAGSIYVELGANVGSCLMQLLLNTDAYIVAFEPNPQNLFCLTSTLLRQDARTRARVALFPLGAGDAAQVNVVYTEAINKGNSVIQSSIKDRPDRLMLPPIRVVVRRLDEIFKSQFHVSLMKMDIQGFECKAMAGMQHLLPSIDILKTEIANLWLTGQGCSDRGLFELLRKAGYDVHDDTMRTLKVPLSKQVYDIVAVKRAT